MERKLLKDKILSKKERIGREVKGMVDGRIKS
jgi:hypothetical protein